MTSANIRSSYIEFFIERGHKVSPSSSLIPENDPTTLFTSSGMQPLVPYLLGEEHPLGQRLVNSQRAFRSQDIDEVGDNRHTTFFEMLGNWSLGDYFKKEQLHWIFEFLTKKLKIDFHKLKVTVFAGNDDIKLDNESILIWQNIFASVGIKAQLGKVIYSYPAEKNWWSRSGPPENMPEGEPGGPSSEIFYDFGTPHDKKYGEICHPNCDCGRFLEIGNSVFMEYRKNNKSGLDRLHKKNVDFGGGLERLACVVANQNDIFQIDLFSPLIKTLERLASKSYTDIKYKKPFRIIADHLKAAVFIISDGVVPSNKLQGYILRRLIRRSIVYGRELGLPVKDNFVSHLVDPIIEIYRDFYPYLLTKQQEVKYTLSEESSRFVKVIDKGLEMIKKTEKLDGKIAFYLYETYGFPWEMTQELISSQGRQIDRLDFENEFRKHQLLSRTTSSGVFKGGLADHSHETTKLHTATHLLHQALRVILGSHVTQKGSHITRERLRFDFSHPGKLSADELTKIQDLVNKQIASNLPVSYQINSLKDALRDGALANFKDKYDQKVKVYTIGSPTGGWFSKEVCGGPHVDFTSSLGSFRIKKEEGVSAGVRRIYAELIP